MASPKVGVDVPITTPRSPQIVSPSTSSIAVKSRNTKKVLAGLVVGAAVITAIAVPLAARNHASQSSSSTSSQSTNQQVVVDESGSGCADGSREWYKNSATFTDIAGCAGAWTNAGLVEEDGVNHWPVPKGKTGLAACSAIGNSATSNAAGSGCNGADLCAAGWHICGSDAEVAAKSGGAGCDNANQVAAGGVGFFATAQTGSGNTHCDALPNSFNDIFGCGTDGSTAVAADCAPLTRFTHNLCSGLTASGNGWNCGGNGYNESRAIIHSTNLGGVLCCKDQAVECVASADGWTVTGVDGYVSYALQASSYSSSCTSLVGTSLTIEASSEVPTEFLVNLYRTAGACSTQRPDEAVYCPAYTDGGDNEYQAE